MLIFSCVRFQYASSPARLLYRNKEKPSSVPESKTEPSGPKDVAKVMGRVEKILRGAESELEKIERNARDRRIKAWFDLGGKLERASFRTPAQKATVMVVFRRLQGSNDMTGARSRDRWKAAKDSGTFNSQEQFEKAARELTSVIGDDVDWWNDILRTSEALQDLFPKQTIAALKKLYQNDVSRSELGPLEVGRCFDDIRQCAEELKGLYPSSARRFDQFIENASRQKEKLLSEPSFGFSTNVVGLVVQQLSDLVREIGGEPEDIYRIYERMPLRDRKYLLQAHLLGRALVTTDEQARPYLKGWRLVETLQAEEMPDGGLVEVMRKYEEMVNGV